MDSSKRFGSAAEFDIQQLSQEAKHRWLRPAEICEILRNYPRLRIGAEPPNRPPSGSLFLFDRKVLRYFRKDGHNWKKKKDGKTVKEAHERLKDESIDVLHCYYAHGEENDNFQRRVYWMLEEAFMHIVLVHYLEIKGNKASYGRSRGSEEITLVTPVDSTACSNSFKNENQLYSQAMGADSPNSSLMSEYEAESDNRQARTGYYPFFGLQQYDDGPVKDARPVHPYVTVPSPVSHCYQQSLQAETLESDVSSVSQEGKARLFDDMGFDLTFDGSRTQLDLPSWSELLGHYSTGCQSPLANTGGIHDHETLTFEDLFTDDFSMKQNAIEYESQVFDAEDCSLATTNNNLKGDGSIEGKLNHLVRSRQSSFDLSNNKGEGLKKHDSFSRWMSREFGEVGDLHMKSSFDSHWNSLEGGNIIEDSRLSVPEHLDTYVLGPSVSEDQLFSIIDFSPNWAYTNLETKVLITGTFLKNKQDLKNCKLSCMFGEVEVPTEVLSDCMLRCHVPAHKVGMVPFYITCSNRTACSEVREFEYRAADAQDMEYFESCSSSNEMHLQTRLEKLLSLGTAGDSRPASSSTYEKLHLINKISSLLKISDDEWFDMLKLTEVKGYSPDSAEDQLLQNSLKEKLHNWLVQKIAEEGKCPNLLDKDGQGMLHLAAALGYDWALKPIIVAGVSINFRDVRGWTALHWAAFSGRERTVISLISLGADPGVLTDPTSVFPSGRTPADLASENGHRGIAGFLAESLLTSHLSVLTLKDTGGVDITEVSSVEGVENIAEQNAIQLIDGDMPDSLKDSLAAVRNASLAAARIHQVFRVQSFQRKKLVEHGDNKCRMSDERALSIISMKTSKQGQHDMPVHAAALRIQNKFRGWKGRNEFLTIRQRIVKIQAHVRGHQVRKRYKKIITTVCIVEKVILRWRRRGSGLRGFHSEGLLEGPAVQTKPVKEDDYDFLQEGRKQTEARLEKALARVKSMVHYPEARDQYSRLMTAMQAGNLTESEEVDDGQFMMELEGIWEDDPLMHFAP